MLNAGVRIGLGTDSGPAPARFEGFFEHLEMELMVKYGMTPMQVIQAFSKTNSESWASTRITGLWPKARWPIWLSSTRTLWMTSSIRASLAPYTSAERNSSRRRHAEERISDIVIRRRVFLGLDHAFGGGAPVLWETMVFGGKLDQEQDRCSGSREQAEAMHARMVEKVKCSNDPDQRPGEQPKS